MASRKLQASAKAAQMCGRPMSQQSWWDAWAFDNIACQCDGSVLLPEALANILKSSLGPQGLDKMLVDDIGDVTITNDGATVLKQLEALLCWVCAHGSLYVCVCESSTTTVQEVSFIFATCRWSIRQRRFWSSWPICRRSLLMCCFQCQELPSSWQRQFAQDSEVGDGTTSVVIIAAELCLCCKTFSVVFMQLKLQALLRRGTVFRQLLSSCQATMEQGGRVCVQVLPAQAKEGK